MSDILHDNDPMGFVYVCESFGGDSSISNMDIDKSKGPELFFVTFDTNLQDFDVKNRNQRYYDGQNIWECILTEKIQSLLKTNGWFGEFDHPTPEIQGQKLTPERVQSVPPKYRAFRIMAPALRGNLLQAKIQTTQNSIGKEMAGEIITGWVPQFSARCIANMISKNGKPYVHVRRLITYDAVTFPSHAEAHAISKPEAHIKAFKEKAGLAIETAVDTINGIIVPLKEILMDVGRTDVNSQVILESFDLSMDNMMGFDEKKEHVLIKDDNNVIYSKMNPNTVKRVNDFFASF